MKRNRINQSGFGGVEVIFLISVICLLASIFLYINHKQHAINPMTKAVTKQNARSKTDIVGAVNTWQDVAFTPGWESIKIPGNWQYARCYSKDTVVVGSSKSNLAKCEEPNTGMMSFTVAEAGVASSAPNPGTKSETIDVDGVTGNKSWYTSDGDSTVLTYKFALDNKVLIASYLVKPTEPDDSKIFDQIVRTWKF